jgi:hypothetical protein
MRSRSSWFGFSGTAGARNWGTRGRRGGSQSQWVALACMPCNWQVLRPRDSPRAEETSAAMAMVHGDNVQCGANCKERRGEWLRAWKTVRDCMQCRSPCVSVTLGPLGMWRRAWSLALWPLLLASILAGERACMGARCRSGSWCILFPALTTALAFLSCFALLWAPPPPARVLVLASPSPGDRTCRLY